MKTEGMIYGIGVGIGDPEDITLKAVKCIKESDVLILPSSNLEKCRAYQIAKKTVPEIKDIDTLPLEFKMVRDESIRGKNHQIIYETVKKLVLDEKKIVSFLTIGDPAIYSTYSYIAELAKKDGIKTQAVSGVSSINACANRLGITLCEAGTQLHVIPDTENIESMLELPGTKVIMKCGRNISVIKEKLKDKRVSAWAVENCGMPEEKCYRGFDEIPDSGNYMLTVIVKEENEEI